MANPIFTRMTGKHGYVLVANSENIAQEIQFTSWTAKIKRTFDDITISINYNPRTAMTYTAAVPVTMSMTVDVAGRFHRCASSQGVVDLMFNSSRRPFRARIGFTPNDPYADFWGFMENLEVTNPAEGIVDFSCTMRSFGLIQDVTMVGCGEYPPVDKDYSGSSSPDYPSPGTPSPDYPSPGTP